MYNILEVSRKIQIHVVEEIACSMYNSANKNLVYRTLLLDVTLFYF